TLANPSKNKTNPIKVASYNLIRSIFYNNTNKKVPPKPPKIKKKTPKPHDTPPTTPKKPQTPPTTTTKPKPKKPKTPNHPKKQT
ncbi:hypothetical protein, partial [Stenotrophomonas maltophilia]|uniref:hypothetical protein n=1 Tax=Stenotrophomonas maltophilia TaxID=40324 RepID=UPI00313DA2AD